MRRFPLKLCRSIADEVWQRTVRRWDSLPALPELDAKRLSMDSESIDCPAGEPIDYVSERFALRIQLADEIVFPLCPRPATQKLPPMR